MQRELESAQAGTLAKAEQLKLMDQFYKQHRAKRLRIWRDAAVIVGAVIFVGGTAWLSYRLYQRQQVSRQIPPAISQSLAFSAYVPTGKFHTKAQSPTLSQDVLSFSVAADGRQFLITEQVQPDDFELGRFINGTGITESREVLIPAGKALQGKVMNRNIIIISASGTLITITTSGPANTLEPLAHSLTKI